MGAYILFYFFLSTAEFEGICHSVGHQLVESGLKGGSGHSGPGSKF